MSITTRILCCWLAIAGVGAGALAESTAAGAALPAGAGPTFDYARDATTIVLRYSRLPGEVGELDRGSTFTLWGDGRAVVHVPAYMRRAGDHELVLEDEEVQRLLRFVLGKGVLEFEPEAVRRRMDRIVEKRREGAGSGTVELFESVDADTTLLELDLKRYRPAGRLAAMAAPVRKTLAWYGLAADVERFPEVPALRRLRAVELMLLELMERAATGGEE